LSTFSPSTDTPDRLGRWPAAAGLLVFTWIELVSGWGEEQRMLAFAVLGYTAPRRRRQSPPLHPRSHLAALITTSLH